jgi:hypothetical protein
MTETGHGTGALLDTPDERDFQWSELGKALPPFDWNKGFDIEDTVKLYVDDQNGSSSCGGQATSKYAAVLEAIATQSFERRSAAYIYNQTAIIVNGEPQGSRMRDNADLVVKQGVALESLCPSYDHGKPPTDSYILGLTISKEASDSAKYAKGKSYAYVVSNIDSYAQAIAANNGLITLFGAENNGTWLSEFPKPPVHREWGHFVYCGKAKLINGKKYIGFLNSWGENCGNKGWQWFGEDYFNSGFIYQGCTIVLDSIPTPPSYTFTRDLKLGMSGIDVKMLQVFLNKHGFHVAESGAGSPGNETSYFGTLTKNALAKFQAAKGISPAVGYFGAITRGVINSA